MYQISYLSTISPTHGRCGWEKGGKSIRRIVPSVGDFKRHFPMIHTMGVFLYYLESVFPFFIRECNAQLFFPLPNGSCFTNSMFVLNEVIE